MKKWKTLGVLVVICTMVSIPSFAADVAKIGVINVQKILRTSSMGKMIKAQMNKKAREMQEIFQAKKDEIQKLNENLERESLVLSKEKQEERKREIRIKINDIKSLQKTYEDEMKVLNDNAVKRVQTDVLNIVEGIGKKEGYLLIISTEVVLYSPTANDITDQVVQAYNEFTANELPEFDIENLKP